MDKNAIKKYAIWARRELIEKVSQKALQYGIEAGKELDPKLDSINGVLLTDDEKKQRQALIRKINENGYTQVMEEVAYTWFNRFIALRFMEVNGYLPSHVRVFTDEAGEFKPQIMSEALHLELEGLDMEKVYELKNDNRDDDLFKYLLITQCNALSSIFPKMFQKIADYTELLLPDYLLREGSVIEQMVNQKDGIPEDDWKDQVQILGWLYQYYNTELKAKADNDVKAGLKIDKRNLPEKTQVFTPDWIVRYMVENSLGRLWIEGHPNKELKSKWNYYLPDSKQEEIVETQLEEIRREYSLLKPEEIRVIDPCSGSGHILCVLFDVLVDIYEDFGYTSREAAISIIRNNLWGLDIDERASQLSYFTIMMKARQYDRRFLLRKDENGEPDIPQPHVYSIEESNGITTTHMHDMGLALSQEEHKKAIDQIVKLVDELKDAKEYGSIMKITPCDWDLLRRFAIPRDDDGQMRLDIHGEVEVSERLRHLISIGEALSQKYHSVVTNPPYLGLRSIGAKTLEYIQEFYPNSKNDFFAVFIERALAMTLPIGHIGMVTAESWLSLSSFEKMRVEVLSGTTITTMAHLGEGAFDAGFGTVAFTILKKYVGNYTGTYFKLNDIEDGDWKERIILQKTKQYCYYAKQQDFDYVPGMAVSYWVSSRIFDTFTKYPSMNDIAEPRQGLTTCDNNRFMRFWYEVPFMNIGLGFTSTDMTIEASQRWFPYNKGGEPRKWYGNNEYVVNWQHDGQEVKEFVASKYVSYSRTVKNIPYYFRKGLTWSAIAKKYAVRAYNEGFIFADKGQACFVEESNYYYICGLLNSKYTDTILAIISPTLDFNCGYIKKIPVAIEEKNKNYINTMVKENIEISKKDWDSFETSWDFEMHPFIRIDRSKAISGGTFAVANVAHYYEEGLEANCPIEASFLMWKAECNARFQQLKENEEELNRVYISIYGLQEELTPEVEDKDMTVRLADLQRDIRSFISYAVGCMFGRYSLDVPGLVYAGGEWDTSKYKTFQADADAIIPICDDEYFEDDIVGRFVKFVEVVYGKDTLEDNLKFIAYALGGNGTSREVIRNYFINDFYADHVKIYQKRPIYWLFDSGKKNGFKCLIYMHRYQPDTIARIRTDYVHEQQARYRTAIEEIEKRIDSVSSSEKVKLNKKLNTLRDQDEEIHTYEEKIHHLADQMISIDLDDGVKHNYALFQDVLAKIK